jgi:hypothetical protein
MKKGDGKKLLMLIGALFVAAIFLSSYLSSNNSGTATTSTKPSSTYLAIGRASATITGYGSNAYVPLSNQSNDTMENVSAALSGLEANGSISNYIHVGDGYQVALSGMDAYALQQSIRKGTALVHSNITTTAYLLLPANEVLYVNSYPVDVAFSRRNYSISLAGLEPVGSHLNVSVFALITANGSVYNNQIRINYT